MLPGSCADPVVPCCRNLYDMVDTLVQAAAGAVEACIGESCPEFGRWVNHAPAVGPSNYVAGTVVDIRPAPSRQAVTGTKQWMTLKQLVTVEVRLVEDGYPTLEVKGSRISKPSSAEFNYAALHSYGHGEVAFRALTRAAQGLCGNGCCDSMQMNFARPLPPESNLATWEYTLVGTWTP